MKKGFFFLTLIFILELLGCSATLPRTAYLAKVNEDLITMDDVRQEFKKRHGGHEKFLAGEVEIRRFLENVVDQRLLIQEAYRLDLQNDPEIREATNEFQAERLREYLVNREIKEKSKATEEEVKRIYDTKMEEQFQTQQIIVSSKEEAEEILKRVQSGEDFGAMAREKSIAPSKKYGGRLPPMGWGFMDPEWERIVFNLSPEEVSPVFKRKMGYEIIRLESKTTLAKPEFDKVKNQIKAILERRRLEERNKEFTDFLRNKYAVQMSSFDMTVENLKKALEQKTEEPLATWNGETLSLYSFASQLNLDLLSTLPRDQGRDQLKSLLDEVVNTKLLEKEAISRGYERVPEVSEKVRQYREGLMENKLYANYVLSDMKTTDEELRQYYDQNQKEFVFPEKRKIAHILVDSLDSAEDILKRLKEGQSFEELARSYSKDSQTADRGGELGWIGKGQILPALEKIVFLLKAREVSDPLKTDLGYHIIKLLEIQPLQVKNFSQAKKEVENKVLKKMRDEKIKLWVDRLKAVSQIEISEEGIQSSVKKVQEDPSKMGKGLDTEKNTK